ncbi:hypothetical protein WMF04_02180 [Sorangium sp. So ce260]|uniref:hypothetical protein n=1 Tax=Sorangium sp. So ce260 TaxID=3133291 RepID=UPI003F61EB6E
MLQLFRGRLSQDASFSEYTWDNLKRLAIVNGDEEFILIQVVIHTMVLHDGGTSTLGPPPSFKYTVPADVESLRKYHDFDLLLALRQKQYEERQRSSTELQQAAAREPRFAAPTAVHHYHAPVHTAATYNSTFVGSTVGAVALGDHATATGKVDRSAASLTQERHQAAVKEARKALLDDEDLLEAQVYEALTRFLISVREVQVEGLPLLEVQAAMAAALKEAWPQQGTMQPLPHGLAVIEALGQHPSMAEVTKRLRAVASAPSNVPPPPR